MSREDRRQNNMDNNNNNKAGVDEDGLAQDVADGPEDYGVISEQIEAIEDDIDAITDRIIDDLENMVALLKKHRKELSREKSQ